MIHDSQVVQTCTHMDTYSCKKNAAQICGTMYIHLKSEVNSPKNQLLLCSYYKRCPTGIHYLFEFLQNSYCLEELLNAVTGQCFNARASNAELGSDETFLASLFIAFHM